MDKHAYDAQLDKFKIEIMLNNAKPQNDLERTRLLLASTTWRAVHVETVNSIKYQTNKELNVLDITDLYCLI